MRTKTQRDSMINAVHFHAIVKRNECEKVATHNRSQEANENSLDAN